MRSTTISNRLERIPTALSRLEQDALKVFAAGSYVVEAGALLGYSTLLMSDVATAVVSIDRHEGYGAATLTRFMSNIEGVPNIRLIVGDARKWLPGIDSVDGAPCRYFFDLTGGFELTKSVIEATPPQSLIAVHDFNRPHCEGVERAILESGSRILHVVDTLAIIQRGKR